MCYFYATTFSYGPLVRTGSWVHRKSKASVEVERGGPVFCQKTGPSSKSLLCLPGDATADTFSLIPALRQADNLRIVLRFRLRGR